MQLIANVTSRLNISRSEISRFSSLAPKMYKIYTIPKRRSGHRVIAHPSKNLKVYQRTLLSIFEEELPIHDAAFAYRKSISIKDNASYHKKNPFLLKMDFHNFFNSITPKLFWEQVNNHGIIIPKIEQKILTGLIFWSPSKRLGGKLCLSVGAPTSPIISNFIMYNFDKIVFDICQKNDIKYTRYADDLTFSTSKKDILFNIPKVVKSVLSHLFSDTILVNEQKTVFSSKAHNRHVTGITITNDGKLSIGRDKKKYVYHLLHKFSLNELNEHDTLHLSGLFSFACHIDVLFRMRAIKKYGETLIEKLENVDKGKSHDR